MAVTEAEISTSLAEIGELGELMNAAVEALLDKVRATECWAVPREVDTGFHAAMGISVAL